MDKDKSQAERFKEAAQKLKTDEDEGRFNAKLAKLIKRKPIHPRSA